MHEECKFVEQFKKNQRRMKAPPSLNIPDPVELFKVEMLNRPPSVPALIRRISYESILNNRNSGSPILWRLPMKQCRRKSIPDRLHNNLRNSHRKSDSKLKELHQQTENKPPLDKSSKICKNKSLKNIGKKSSLGTPYMNKVKKTIYKAVVCEVEKKRLENHTPNKILRKNSQGKEHEEHRKTSVERKFICKHEDDKAGKHRKPFHMPSKSVLSLKCEEKPGKSVKKCLAEPERISPPRKCRQKTDFAEPSSSHSKLSKKKTKDTDVKKHRKLSSDAKTKPKLLKKPSKKKIHKKLEQPKADLIENWFENRFFMNSNRKKEKTLEFDDRSYEQLNKFDALDIDSSKNVHLGFSIPSTEERLSNLFSISNFSVPGPRPKSPVSALDQSRKIKIYKKPKNKNSVHEKAAVLIQKLFRGYLVRKNIQFIEHEKHRFGIKKTNEVKKIALVELSKAEEASKIISEPQYDSKSPQDGFSDEFLGFSEENTDKSEHQAPKPAEIQSPKTLSPIHSAALLKISELTKRLKQDQKSCEFLENSSKEQESHLQLDSLKQNKSSIEDLRKRDLKAIKKITSKAGSESEIFEIFQKIINRRYETINSMFEDNLKSVQEALTHSVVLEDSFSNKADNRVSRASNMPLQTSETITLSAEAVKKDLHEEVLVKRMNFDEIKTEAVNAHEARFYKKLAKCVKRVETPEIISPGLVFFGLPQAGGSVLFEAEVENCKNIIIVNCFKGLIDEVTLPNQTDYVIDSVLSHLYQYLLADAINSLFTISADYLSTLSEELLQTLLFHEIDSKCEAIHKSFNEESILNIIQKIFIKTHHLIISELLKPLESDPISALAEIQEAELGCGFPTEEKYAMLNFEAFNEDLNTESRFINTFNLMVFDCINDCLEKLIVKEDLPWATQRERRVVVKSAQDAIQYIVSRLIGFSEIRAGEVLLGRSEEEISEKREKDVGKMIEVEMREEEEGWVRFDKEEVQAELDLADMILEDEVCGIFDVLFNERN